MPSKLEYLEYSTLTLINKYPMPDEVFLSNYRYIEFRQTTAYFGHFSYFNNTNMICAVNLYFFSSKIATTKFSRNLLHLGTVTFA